MDTFARVVDLIGYIVIIDVLLRWVQRPNQAPLKWTMQLTEPLYAPLRSVIPPIQGLDLSPLILIVGLRLISRMLWSAF